MYAQNFNLSVQFLLTSAIGTKNPPAFQQGDFLSDSTFDYESFITFPFSSDYQGKKGHTIGMMIRDTMKETMIKGIPAFM